MMFSSKGDLLHLRYFFSTDKLFGRTGQAKFLSKIDRMTGCHQIRIHRNDIDSTEFTAKYDKFEYIVMEMRFCNAPAIFQALMNSIFRDVIDGLVLIQLDHLLTVRTKRNIENMWKLYLSD